MHQDPPDLWNKYWVVFPATIPKQLRPMVKDGLVNNDIIKGNCVLKAMVPSFKRSKGRDKDQDNQSQLCGILLDIIIQLFSVPGLFNTLAEHDGLMRAPTQDLKKIQGDYTTLTEKDFVYWAMHCGITEELIVLAEQVGRIYCNYALKCEVEDDGLWPDWPRTIEEVLQLPTVAEQEQSRSTTQQMPQCTTPPPSRLTESSIVNQDKGKGRARGKNSDTISFGSWETHQEKITLLDRPIRPSE